VHVLAEVEEVRQGGQLRAFAVLGCSKHTLSHTKSH
jgi:hypothetical protein